MKYRQVIAGLLAASLILNTVPTSMIAKASSESTVNVSEYADNTGEDNKEQETVETPSADEDSNQNSGGESDGSNEKTTDEVPAEDTVSAAEDAIDLTAVNDEFTLEQLKQANIEGLTVANNNTSVTASTVGALILLSHCKADELKNLTIDINITGTTVDLTTSVTGPDGQQYTFVGFGNETAPFEGAITGQKPVIKANRAIFGGLSSKASVVAGQQINWAGDGSTPMLADTYVLADGATASLPVTFTNGTGAIIGKVMGSGTLQIGGQITYRDSVSVTGASNAGLICNTLESGSIQVADGYSLPANGYSVTASAGNAGGLIGQMNTGTSLTIDSSAEVQLSKLSVTASAGNAGGLVGQMDSDAALNMNQTFTLDSPQITGKTNAGGLIGMASNVLFAESNQKMKVSSPQVTANASGTVGGVIGRYELSGKGEQKFPECIEMKDPVLQVSGSSNGTGYAGGYFGVLGITNGSSYYFGKEDKTVDVNVTLNHSEFIRAYGTIVGGVYGNGTSNAIVVKKMNIVSNYCRKDREDREDREDARYHGDVVGELGFSDDKGQAVYLEADTIKVEDAKPYAYKDDYTYSKTNDRAYGGVVGLASQGTTSKISNFTINTGNGEITKGGGVIGYAEAGSAIELSGKTDLSSARYAKYWSAGQIVGGQDSALIYARGDGEGYGWTLERCLSEAASKNNDIGNYGEVIRLKADGASTGLSADLITIDETTHQIILKSPSDSNFLDGAVLNDTDDFALLAIAWQAHGAFPVAGVSTDNYKNLQTQTITLNSDVDLSGTGITGISRDSQQDAMVYSGTMDGQGHKVTLALGETYGLRGGSEIEAEAEGGGKIYPYKWGEVYSHTNIGMFAQSRGNINKLTIAGQIVMSNASDYSSVGGFAARARGSMTLSEVTAEESIVIDAPASRRVYAGGLFGDIIDGSSNIEVTIQKNSVVKPNITIKKLRKSTDSYINAGSAIGYATGNFRKLACNGLTIGGTIKVEGDSYNYAYVGGLVARINRSSLAWIEIRSLVYDGFKIEAENAQKICGGLFGSVWSNVGVYFMGESDSSDGIYTGTKLTVKDAEIKAPSASVGGLTYRSSGLWEIRKKGIDMQKFSITAGNDVGLLVARGERGEEVLEGKSTAMNSLYLKTTTYWNDADNYAYKIGNDVQISCGGIFDEFVAYTAASADAITTNNVNGIVSIATNNREGVAEQEGTCTTYANRTAFGKKHQTNACSRYYYDLDQCYTDAKTTKNDRIDTRQELLLWSVYQYADPTLKGYFIRDNGQSDKVFLTDAACNVIGGASDTQKAKLDMQKYSYYPVDLETSDMTIQNAIIKFYNEDIEKAETREQNKSTSKTDGNSTQHYMMHCGLFLNHTREQSTSTINVNNVTFQGTIGKTGLGSGVLFGGKVEGNSVNAQLYPVTMNFEGVTLDGIRVYNCGTSYAPLFMNQLSSYTTLVADDVKTTAEYDKNTDKKAGSSLIGNVGSETGNQINMTFTGIVLPDQSYTFGGIFTHATLLESFQYAADGIAVATYNFYKNEDWNGTEHVHQVTYGKEISGSVEYKDLQKWYFDREGYGEETGEVYSDNGQKDFSNYLPYVCNKELPENSNPHEIRVNQRPFGITDGCGTYGHPYKITSEKEMDIIAEYIATGNAQKDWEIRVTTDQNTICPGDNSGHDLVYQYDGRNWVSEDKSSTLSNDAMHRYMLGAYYDIHGSHDTTTATLGAQTFEMESGNEGNTLTLTDFRGFGTEEYPFRGVITCTDKENPTTIILKGSGTGNGLIPYSYGSVVKDIAISYQKDDKLVGKTVTYAKNTKSDYYPSSFFGGVIGCIMGGDNIIDNVSVNMAEQWLNLDGTKKYLIQAGGYVGSVVGGGVIFRGLTGKTGLSSTNVVGGDPSSDAYLYINPYIGRILDGYAFSEGCKLNNTNKNYKINKLDSSDQNCIVTTGDGTGKVTRTNPLQTQVKDAQGLLVLSAIVNSGAAAGGDTATVGTNAYSGNVDNSDAKYKFGNGLYGKVRNASYDHIGEAESADFAVSVSDDCKAPGYNASGQEAQTSATLDASTNAPYLIKKYANPSTFYIGGNARSTSITLAANATYDMSAYGTGYQGISARYLSNALYSTIGKATLSERVVPWVTSVDGNGSRLKVNMPVQEYGDDDFHAASVGGMFNILRQVPEEVPADQRSTYNMLQDLTIGDSAKTSNITLTYRGDFDASTFGTNDNHNNQYNVGVGGFAGSTAGTSSGVKQAATANIRFEDVSLDNVTISGPARAGGLFANVGCGAGTNTDIGYLIGQSTTTYNNYYGLNLINCKYANLNVTSKYASGGFAGYVDSESNALVSSVKNTKDQELVIGDNSTITANTNTSYAGGVFGYVKTNVRINDPEDATNYKKVIINNVSVKATNQAGGYIGQIADFNNNGFKIYNAVYQNQKVEAGNNAGGLIGNSESKTSNVISQCIIDKVTLNTANNGTKQEGGLIGRLGNSGSVNVSSSIVKSLKAYGAYTGGLFGEIIGAVTVSDTNITGTGTEKTTLNSQNGSSAIFGRLSTSSPITVERCKIDKTEITATAWSGSVFSGDIHYQNGQKADYSIYDSSVSDVQITAPFSGGIAGQLRGTMTASNISLSNVSIIGQNANSGLSGVLIADGRTMQNAYIAGISLKNISLTNKNGKAADNLYGYDSDATKESIGNKCYFAFADYTGSALSAGSAGSDAGTEEDSLLEATAVSPYVVTSSKSSLKVKKDDKEQSLYGDGAVWSEKDGKFTVNAETIANEKTSPTDGRFAYKNTGVDSFDFESAMSTYNANQSNEAATDFPVLQISGGNTESVSDYLDILTNGGFSAANALNTSTAKHVTVKADVYSYQNDGFVYDAQQSSALSATTDQNGRISFTATTDYDNDKDRFVLLTVTFTERGHSYNLQVPVLVRRMLEIDFMATLSHGTHYKSDDYTSLTSHVLDSFGNTITGYLTYVYNSASGKYVDYGWQNYIDAGGDVAQIMDKRIKCNLPAGTQLSLIDCQDENKTVYYHDITAEEAANQEILLSNFKNTDGNLFMQKSIAEIMGAKAEPSSSGKFIKVDKNGKPEGGKDGQTYAAPTVRIGDEYYRLAGDGETGGYNITVDESALKNGTESTKSESYYLVITVPVESTDESFINGGIDTRLNITVPKSYNYMLRNGQPDPQNNSSSTYQISNGYTQNLQENLADAIQPVKLISAADTVMHVALKDEITFPNGQAYLTSDQLYQKFAGSIQTNRMVNGEQQTSTSQFPSGTSGTVHYYIYTENNGTKTYYSYNNGKWTDGSTSKTEVVDGGYEWVSDGGNMELILSTDGTLKNAISLQGFRDKIKGSDNSKSTTFYVEAEMDASLPATGLDVIPESKLINGAPEDYAKLMYTSVLSAETDSLTYSNNRASLDANDTKVSYYRDEPEGVQFTYEADYIDQLGINLLDLGQNVDVDQKYANIDTTAIYDLSAMKNLDETLRNSEGVRFTLQLVPKSNGTSKEEYGSALADAKDYMDVQLNSPDSGSVTESGGTWSWIIPKETYVESEQRNLKNNNVFNGTVFTQAICLKVHVDNVEEKELQHYYSNYKVVLTAEILGSDNQPISDTRKDDYIIYTMTKIRPEFVE